MFELMRALLLRSGRVCGVNYYRFFKVYNEVEEALSYTTEFYSRSILIDINSISRTTSLHTP